MSRPLRIAQVAPPYEPVPPPAYGGTERVVGELVRALVARGHEVTTFASGDSTVPGNLVATVPAALWRSGFVGDAAPWFIATLDAVAERAREFDVIHSHVEWYGPLLARAVRVPVVATWHGRLDLPWAHRLLERATTRNVAISRAQAATHATVPWAAVVHNGLALDSAPFVEGPGDGLCFVGRIAPEKGVVDAIEVALRSGRTLRIAAKSGKTPAERDYLEAVFRPALNRAGPAVEWLGEVSIEERDALLASSAATLMPGEWPEPFGLVAIESLACGTPVLARPVGGLPEIVRDGIDGYLRADVPGLAGAVEGLGVLDREAMRRSVLERFSADQMTTAYEDVYRGALEGPASVRAVMAGAGGRGIGGQGRATDSGSSRAVGSARR
jgi:glycosyltransferase involved in cell wall biosynthesis